MRVVLRAGLVVSCLLAGSYAAAREGSRLEQEVAHVDSATEAAYVEVLARYAQATEPGADDASLIVERCEFIERYSDPEAGRFLARSEADAEACEDSLDALGDAPEVLVHRFERTWDEDARESGEALLARSDTWPMPLRRRMTAALAERYRYADDKQGRRDDLLVAAAELGHGEHVGPAVKAMVETGEYRRATVLLERAGPATDDWIASERVRAALAMPDRAVSLRELQRHTADGREIVPALAALVYLRAGDTQSAKAAIDAANGFENEELREARFKVALARGDFAAAADAVHMNDMEHLAQNTGRFLALVRVSPASVLLPGLWLSLAILSAYLIFYLLLPGLLLVPVHYRGLVRRCAGRPPSPLFEPVGLRHAWLAAIAFMLVPMVVLAVIDPEGFGPVFAEGTNPDPARLLQWVSISNAVSLLLFVPMFATLARLGCFHPGALATAWWRILVAIAATLAVGTALAVLHHATGADTVTQQVEMVQQLVDSGDTPWKGSFALLVIAALVPIWEEFAFRGMILGGIARHIGFGWANFLQALAFAACHMDWPRFPYYLVMGLMAGWLVRSTGSLAPAIAMHMAINALAFALQRS
ncbi:type II CAAX endopeptidase family protein [Luteimonas kalidii]|uniref:Type II CAAX endopeptidase family protein n=1 Tax=Luteimonas kalidii TaxID=3042025 RepID=A0ABT6JQ87_9GAMM|nr:type II CAAX endopeptidase family protein [Luteimonas kalidii]MDH5832840.1 type II CAAX endopeptidase family protein [Luteimonas kalidii]